MIGLKAREEPSTHRTRRADLGRPLQGRLWGWGAAVALLLCCSLRFAAADRPVDDVLPAWVLGALQQAAKLLATRDAQGRLQETPPVIPAFDASPNASGLLATFQPEGETQTASNAFKCADIGKVKGPILRGLAARAPYFHNGSAATLDEVVAFYDTRFQLNLTRQEQADLVAFLRAL